MKELLLNSEGDFGTHLLSLLVDEVLVKVSRPHSKVAMQFTIT